MESARNNTTQSSIASASRSFYSQLMLLKPIRITNAKQSSFIQWKIITLEMFTAFFSFLSIIVSIVVKNSQDKIQTIYILLTALTLINIVLIIFVKLSLKKLLFLRKDNKNWMRRLWIEGLVEIIFYVPHPTLWTEQIVFSLVLFDSKYTYYLNDILSIFVFGRSISMIRFFFKCSTFYGTRAQRLAQLSGFQINSDIGLLYSIKCFYKSYKITSTLLSLGVLVVIFGYLETFAEESNEFMMGFDMIYYAIISFSTVGFGDIVPKTALGRIIVASLLAFVQILISLSTLQSLKLFQLSKPQQGSYYLSKRLKIKDKQKQLQIQNIKGFLKLFQNHKQNQFRSKKLPPSFILQQSKYGVDGVHLLKQLQIFSEKGVMLNKLIELTVNALIEFKMNGSLIRLTKRKTDRVSDNKQTEKLMNLIFSKPDSQNSI